jgi:HipA-like C-terminal domain
MTTDPYPELDVTSWEVVEVEPLGSKPYKRWLRKPGVAEGILEEPVKWLFKPRTSQHLPAGDVPKGDDWAEKVASEIAREVEVPAARIELAKREATLGIISGDVSVGRNLVLGNVVLFQHDPSYPMNQPRRVPGYTVEAIYAALQELAVGPPPGAPPDQDACSVFASYLVLDALIGNTDRHHMNWGVLDDPGSPRVLAPTFDHASSLAFLLSDEQRNRRLDTTDPRQTVEAYARRGQSSSFEGSPGLVALAVEAARACPNPAAGDWLTRVAGYSLDSFDAVLDRMPEARMSGSSRMFARSLVAENQRRLLDELARAL